jgi:hypothetical protein
MSLADIMRRGIDGLASVAVAIPLLVVIAAASILGSLIPQGNNVEPLSDAPEWLRGLDATLQLNDIFHSWWYVALLALLGVSLLAATIKRVPTVWRQRGRGAAAGILLAHVGMFLILGGVIYGGLAGFRYYARLVEGDVTVVPALPFVIKLDRLTLEYHPKGAFGGAETAPRVPKRQESALTLLRHGNAFLEATAAPGQAVVAGGVRLLPSGTDIGWVFTLVVRDPGGREKVIPIVPWAPPLIRLGLSTQRIFAHGVTTVGTARDGAEAVARPDATEVFLLEENGERRSLGFATETTPLSASGYAVSVWGIRPYTGLHIYRRPGTPLLVAGIACLLIGLSISLWRRGMNPASAPGEPRVDRQQQSG